MDLQDDEDSLRNAGPYLDTVRALHQTVVSLRGALEQSRHEISELKTKSWPLESLQSAISALSLENHLLRQQIINKNDNASDKNVNQEQRDDLDNVAFDDRFRPVTVSLENLPKRKSPRENKTSSHQNLSSIGKSPARNARRTKTTRRCTKVETVTVSEKYYEIDGNGNIRSASSSESLERTQIDSDSESSLRRRLGKSVGNLDKLNDNYFRKKHRNYDGVKPRRKTRQQSPRPTTVNRNLEPVTKKHVAIEDENLSFDLRVPDNLQLKSPRFNLPQNCDDSTTEKLTSKLNFAESVEDIIADELNRNIFESSKSWYSKLCNENEDNSKIGLNDPKTVEEVKEVSFDQSYNAQGDNSDYKSHEYLLDDSIAELKASSPTQKPQTFSEYKSHENLSQTRAERDHGEVEKPKKSKRFLEYSSHENLVASARVHNKVKVHKNPDKTLQVSVNLDIYPKMEQKEQKILQHSTSTELLDQEVDDIELIFTNEDTKESNLKEPLISIDGANEGGQNLQCPEFDQNLSADISDRELEDDVFNDNFENENQENSNFQCQTFDFTREIYNSKSDNSVNKEDMKSLKSCYSYQDSSFENRSSMEKDESFDRFEERIRIVETDISKVGIQDVDFPMGRRNTCPNPIQYRPIIHRDALGKGISSRKTRPILAHSNAIRKESGAQTDISALPGNSSWRSESSLAHKVKIGDHFTTLPSRYPMPGSKLRLSEKTVEARRILLSDIGFTSMVPELSRSADHLCPPHLKQAPATAPTSYGQFLKTTDLYSPAYTSQKFVWTNASPSDSHSQSRYSSLYPLASPPTTSRRCSAPVSPCRKAMKQHVPSKVRFANGSLPELRSDWHTIDSGDSTDSLVDEAEQFLRRSIDCIVGGKDSAYYNSTPKTGMRRASAPEATRDNTPPPGWQPFLPRLPRDLRLDYWVKVISPDGRVRGGRVRYIGHLLSQSEQFVGVQLSTPEGLSDGTYNSRRYFQCEPYHGIFVPFKKVIMGWKP